MLGAEKDRSTKKRTEERTKPEKDRAANTCFANRYGCSKQRAQLTTERRRARSAALGGSSSSKFIRDDYSPWTRWTALDVVRVSIRVRGSREGWASHFLSRAIPFIIEFVSGSHVAELIQHQKVIDYTATYKWATTAIFGLLRPSTRISRGHTPPHGRTPSGPHTAAHSPTLTSRACCAEPNGRDSIAGSNTCVVDAGTS